MYWVARPLFVLVAILICPSVAWSAPVVTVDLKGLKKELAENVSFYLTIEQQKDHPLLTTARIQRLHENAPQQIKEALAPYGFYKPSIRSELKEEETEHWRATYTVDAGPPLPVGEFDFALSGEAKDDPRFKELTASLPIGIGKTLNHMDYEAVKSSLVNLAAERGYFDARFLKQEILIDLQAYHAIVRLHFQSGPRYRFGSVNLLQDVITPELMLRFVPFKEGDLYSVGSLVNLQQALIDSDYFGVVEVEPRADQFDGLNVPLDVRLTPKKRHRYTFGLGYGTDTGARGKIGWEMPRVNRRGHRINTEVNVSQIGRAFATKYRIPVRNPRTDELAFSGSIVEENVDQYDRTTRSLGVSLSHARGHWRETLSLTYENEDYDIADQSDESTLLIPGVSWTRIWAEDRINTRRGARVNFNFRGGSEALLSDTNFLQGFTRAKIIVPLGQRGRAIGRGDLGTTTASNFFELPASIRFFTGGAQSVRGYSYQSLSPTNDEGEAVGGRHLIVGSLEYEHGIFGNWSLGVFYDVGNAIDDYDDPLKHGAGFGVRWMSPVGPLRVDLASALSERGDPWRLHLNIGPDL